VNGAVTVAADGAVTQDGKTVQPVKPSRHGPHTIAHVKHHGRQVVLRLVAKARNGVGATFYQLGTGPWTRYVAPLTLARKQLATLSIGSIDSFGNAEPPPRAR
jgi:hypothetical protein